VPGEGIPSAAHALVPTRWASLSARLWLAIVLLLPLGAPWASAADPGLALLETRLAAGVNDFRHEQHLIALERRADLDAVARGTARTARRGFFSHASPEGNTWVERLALAGVTGFTMAGENVGQTNRPDPNREILEGWKNSPAHRENLLSRPMNATCVGIARAPDGTLFYTQLYLSMER
jgi:uncharacterized protein YkwD